MALPSLSRMAYFYPRPPRGGRPDVPAVCPSIFTISIHALREEGDVDDGKVVCIALNFYPRPPRGGRPVIPLKLCGLVEISIHALREEGDACPCCP